MWVEKYGFLGKRSNNNVTKICLLQTTLILNLRHSGRSHPGLVQHVGHLVDPVQQHVHLLLHVLPLPAALVHGVLQHLKVAVLPQQLAVALLLVLLHPDQLALGGERGEPSLS